jgi:signal transduction histidine kinase
VKRLTDHARARRAPRASVLLDRLLVSANQRCSRLEFLESVCRLLLDASGCDGVALRIVHGGRHRRCRVWRPVRGPVACQVGQDDTGSLPRRGVRGTAREFTSVLALPLQVGGATIGRLELGSRRRAFFRAADRDFFASLADSLGATLVHQHAEWSLHERVKELTCLYSIATFTEDLGRPLDEVLQGIVKLLPPAWQHPETAAARLRLDGRTYATAGFREGCPGQRADILVADVRRGTVEVVYTAPRPTLDEGPFLHEERNLINEVARQVGLLVARRDAEAERLRLQERLGQADRLATIGRFAAGAAHELNEPLGAILGFAQLAMKCPGLPTAAQRDLEKILRASLHARHVVQQLMLSARHRPPRPRAVDLNAILEEALEVLQTRWPAPRVKLVRRLARDLPTVVADPDQLRQVMINLVLNAQQAIPGRGTVTVATGTTADHVTFTAADTGRGMSAEELRHIFLPFYTTKEVGQGTGLGLAVVHGIVTSHGGSIIVESEPGHGTRFEVQLPRRRDAAESDHDDAT